ncbi:MAG: BatA domain-containing protein [Chitinispirillaceae bacterium]|nr:BatA domain-containing protein [Chitinispirillaceae bacterium]
MSPFSFYRPEFLWGLLFLGAVLCIHLLRRPPRLSLDFSTLRFFEVQAVKNARMRRLRRLLLLLSRLAAVTVLILLFAQPFDKNDPLNILRNPHLTVFAWIDRTPSMDYREGDCSLLDKAESLADTMMISLPSTVRHLRYDETRGGFTACEPAGTAGSLMAGTRHGPPRLDKVFRAWNESRRDCSLPLLFLLSDFQRSTSAQLDTLFRRTLTTDRDPARILCVDLSPHAPWNYSVRNTRLHESGKVSATVTAYGKNLDSAGLTVAIASVRSARKTVSLRAGDTISAETSAAVNASDALGGCAALDVSDPLSFDNVDYFVSGGRIALRVLIIGDREKNFPLAAAFRSSGKNLWNPVTLRECSDATFDDLDSAEVIIINAVNRTSRPLEALFSGQASRGKTIMCAFDDSEQGFGACASLTAKVGRSPDPLQPVSPAAPAGVVFPDTISETWKGFPSLRTEESSIYRYVKGLPGTVLARLDDGTPFVTHISMENGGSFLFFATPLGATETNNLCETGFYVPFIDRITRYAANEHPDAAGIFTAGFERRNPLYGSGKGATVFGENGKILERWQSQPAVLFKLPGLYKVLPDGEEPYRLSVNAAPEESDCASRFPVIPEASVNNILILKEKSFKRNLGGASKLQYFLPWSLLILFLLAEVLLWESPSALPDDRRQRT